MAIRVQITRKPPLESIDGVRIDSFEVGHVYEIGTSIAAVMLAEGWAIPAPLDEPAPAAMFSEADPFGGTAPEPSDNPPNLTRERFPPYLEQRGLAAAVERRKRPRR